ISVASDRQQGELECDADLQNVVVGHRIREVRVASEQAEQPDAEADPARRAELALAGEPERGAAVDADELVSELEAARDVGAVGAPVVVAVGVEAEVVAGAQPRQAELAADERAAIRERDRAAARDTSEEEPRRARSDLERLVIGCSAARSGGSER